VSKYNYPKQESQCDGGFNIMQRQTGKAKAQYLKWFIDPLENTTPRLNTL